MTTNPSPAGEPATVPAAPAHVDFFFDPVCPFAWITSRWMVEVARARDLTVTWRFLSLRIVNDAKGYDDFPPHYQEGHELGRRLLRVAAAARAAASGGESTPASGDVAAGNDAVGRLYAAYGAELWDRPPGPEGRRRDVDIPAVLDALGLPADLAAAAPDERWDAVLTEETELSLARTGGNTGTPVITVDPPDGPTFFGPIISVIPTGDEALRLWDAFHAIITFPSFAEVKRSLRERPQLAALGEGPARMRVTDTGAVVDAE